MSRFRVVGVFLVTYVITVGAFHRLRSLPRAAPHFLRPAGLALPSSSFSSSSSFASAPRSAAYSNSEEEKGEMPSMYKSASSVYSLRARRSLPGRTSSSSSFSLYVGRRRDELGLSKRQCFLRIRDLVEKAVQSGRFNDTSVIVPEVSLYCQSNIDCTQLGSSHEAQFLQMMLIHKEIPYESFLISPLLIPEGLAAPPLNGRLPSLVHRDFRSSHPIEIAHHLEAAFPDISLSLPGAEACDVAYAKVQGLYPAFYTYIVNKDSALDDELRIAALGELDRVDQLLQRTPGRYLCGVDLTWVDLLLAPTLFHIAVGAEHVKGTKVYNYQYAPSRPAVENYLTRMMERSLFKDKRAYVHIEKIVRGWKLARGDVKMPPNVPNLKIGASEPIAWVPYGSTSMKREDLVASVVSGAGADLGSESNTKPKKAPRSRTAAKSSPSAPEPASPSDTDPITNENTSQDEGKKEEEVPLVAKSKRRTATAQSAESKDKPTKSKPAEPPSAVVAPSKKAPRARKTPSPPSESAASTKVPTPTAASLAAAATVVEGEEATTAKGTRKTKAK